MRPIIALLCACCGLLAACGDDDGGENANNNHNGSAQCGNGTQEAGEECDDGPGNSDVTPNSCRTNCRSPYCGDGVQDTGEECDDGNLSNQDGCLTAGTSAADRCVLNECGDGFVDMTPTGDGSQVEACDDGNTLDEDDCRADCGQDLSQCGDGAEDQGETCDTGQAFLSDTVPNACRTSCQLPLCGDGVADDHFGESCDGSDLGGETCQTLDFHSGDLACDPDTCALDTSGCVTCVFTGPEVCDGVDNDCDGEVDEPTVAYYCYPGAECFLDSNGEWVCVGECRVGTGTCSGGTVVNCTGYTLPEQETCDGKDNDCDGEADEASDLPDDLDNCGGCGRACHKPQTIHECVSGQCQKIACVDGYAEIDGDLDNGCEYQCPVFPPVSETCDGSDNNCNGLVDEGC